VREEDRLRPSTVEKEVEPVSHTVKPLNADASTHRWARTTLRVFVVALLIGYWCFTGLARRREEKKKGLTTVPSLLAGDRPLISLVATP
jgi:hypothetical protein